MTRVRALNTSSQRKGPGTSPWGHISSYRFVPRNLLVNLCAWTCENMLDMGFSNFGAFKLQELVLSKSKVRGILNTTRLGPDLDRNRQI